MNLDFLFESRDGKEILRLGEEFGVDIETLKSFLLQVILDLLKDPEVEQVANANLEAAFKTYLYPKMNAAIAGRFLRNEELLDQLKVDKSLQDEMRDSVWNKIKGD